MQDKHEAIISTINSITSSLTSLRELLKDPSDVYFGRLHPAFEHLETVMSKKTTVDAAFAFIAARDDAGRVVGVKQAGRLPHGETRPHLRRSSVTDKDGAITFCAAC